MKLKKCPFCGADSFVGRWSMSAYWSVGCTDSKCGVSFDNRFSTKKKAVEFWNRRPKGETK